MIAPAITHCFTKQFFSTPAARLAVLGWSAEGALPLDGHRFGLPWCGLSLHRHSNFRLRWQSGRHNHWYHNCIPSGKTPNKIPQKDFKKPAYIGSCGSQIIIQGVLDIFDWQTFDSMHLKPINVTAVMHNKSFIERSSCLKIIRRMLMKRKLKIDLNCQGPTL